MNWSAAVLASGVLCVIILAVPTIVAEDESDDPMQFTDGGFTYFVRAPCEVELSKYTEPENPPSQVRIPESVVFDGASWTVVAINEHVFSSDSCGAMTKSIYIPKTVTTISSWAFSSDYIEHLEVDSANESYWSEDGVLFEKHSDVLVRYPPAKQGSSYVVSEDVIEIAAGAFLDVDVIETVSIGANVIFIGSSAFQKCEGLKEVNFIGGRLREIGASGFSGCIGLESIVMPEGLTYIGYSAFSDCKSLATVYISSTVSSIDESAFDGCTSLADFDLSPDNRNFVIENHAMYEADSNGRYKALVAFPAACGLDELTVEPVDMISPYVFSHSALKKVALPFGMTTVDSCALSGMPCLEEVVLPSTVVKIDILAFSGCTALKSIVLEDSVQIIEYGAFMGCTQLESIIIGEWVLEIGDRAFVGTAIREIFLPASLKSLGESVFESCGSLEYVQIDSTDVTATNSLDMGEGMQDVTVKCYRGALKDLGTVSGNVTFEYYGERSFPMMNLVGIGVCVIMILLILNYLRRI